MPWKFIKILRMRSNSPIVVTFGQLAAITLNSPGIIQIATLDTFPILGTGNEILAWGEGWL